MKLTTSFAMISMLALAIPACAHPGPDESDEALGGGDVSQDDGNGNNDVFNGKNENTGEAEQAATASCQFMEILHYTYYAAPYTYKWDVTYNFDAAFSRSSREAPPAGGG